MKGKGDKLPDCALGSLPLPVTVRLVGSPANPCFEASYNANGVTASDPKKFKAKSKAARAAAHAGG